MKSLLQVCVELGATNSGKTSVDMVIQTTENLGRRTQEEATKSPRKNTNLPRISLLTGLKGRIRETLKN